MSLVTDIEPSFPIYETVTSPFMFTRHYLKELVVELRKRFELLAPSLPRKYSTPELHQHLGERRASNPQHLEPQSSALPIELQSPYKKGEKHKQSYLV